MSFSVLQIDRFPSHQQLPLAQSLYRLLGDNFRFACWEPVPSNREALGWRDVGMDAPWMIRAWETEKAGEEYRDRLVTCDVLIGSPRNRQIIIERSAGKKLSLLPTERPLKHQYSRFWGIPHKLGGEFWPLQVWSYYRYNSQKIRTWHAIDTPFCHILSIGAYCPWDLHRLGLFKDRIWTFGYFIEVPVGKPQKRSEQQTQILWVGRMVDWKRVNVLIKACGILRKKKLDFHLKLIGEGPKKPSLIKLVTKLGLQNMVSFHPPISPQQVQREMKMAHIYVLPSTQEEGWGAVIGEAMAEGCAVISTKGAGAAPILIKHGLSGYLFPVNDIESLAKFLEDLINNPKKNQEMGVEGWNIMRSIWGPDVAADRLVKLIEGLLGREKTPEFQEGPCSTAILKKP
jgi:glycosyltransferase involved in cell wall biosynthesis